MRRRHKLRHASVNINSAPYTVLLTIRFPPEMARQMSSSGRRSAKDQQDFNTRVPESPGMEQLKTPIVTRPRSNRHIFR